MRESHTPYPPSFADDAKSLIVIGVSALFAVGVTGVLFLAAPPADVGEGDPVYEYTYVIGEESPIPAVDPTAGADRLFGRAYTKDGEEWTGYVRWDGTDPGWADIVPATLQERSALAGLRFGQLRRVEPVNGRTVRLVLKTGESVQRTLVSPQPRDGRTNRLLHDVAIDISTVEGDAWSGLLTELAAIDFLPEPVDALPEGVRMYGSVTTVSGLEFAGYLTWDGVGSLDYDEMVLPEGLGASFALGDLVSATRIDGHTVQLALRSGRSIGFPIEAGRGLTVSDPTLGGIEVPWDRIREIRTYQDRSPAAYEHFLAADHLSGVVRTKDGEALSGRVRWDLEEASGWELLEGQFEGIRFHIEFEQIARIQKAWLGASVELRDGRSFYLKASNDVNWNNRGIEVSAGDDVRVIAWDDFRDFRLTGVR